MRYQAGKKVSHTDLRRILERQGTVLHDLAQGAVADFRTFGEELQRTRELLTDALVQIETLKIQVAALLAMHHEPEAK